MATCPTTSLCRTLPWTRQPHDPKVLPHMHCDEDIDKLFPKIEAAPEVANTDDWIPEMDASAEWSAQIRGVMREERGPVRKAPRGRRA